MGWGGGWGVGGGSFVADWPELFTVGLGEDVGENSLGGRYTLLLIFFVGNFISWSDLFK